jgi:hypothetical protein
MIISEKEERFNPRTGKKTGYHHAPKGFACDYCGEFIDGEDGFHEKDMQVAYQTHELLDMEQSWYYMDAPKTPEGKRVKLGDIYENHPHFHYCPDCEMRLGVEWLGTVRGYAPIVNKSQFTALKKFLKYAKLGDVMKNPGTSFSGAMYSARHRVITKLLKTLSPDDLMLEVED